MLHLGLKEFGNESGHHFPECSTLLLCADEFDGVRDLVHVTFQGQPAIGLLFGKYWYRVPTDTPARDATLVVVSRSFPAWSKT
jgi:hypothetical protein